VCAARVETPGFRTRGARARGARSDSVEACRPANARPFAAVRHKKLKPIVWPDVALDSNEVTLQLTNQPFSSKATRARVGEDWVGFDCRLLEGRGALRAVLEEQPGRVSVLVEDLGSAIAGSVRLQCAAHWRARRAPWPAQLRRSKATCVIGLSCMTAPRGADADSGCFRRAADLFRARTVADPARRVSEVGVRPRQMAGATARPSPPEPQPAWPGWCRCLP
jgi:hypothetical protein